MRRILTALVLHRSAAAHPLSCSHPRWKSSSPGEDLQRRVGQLVRTGDVDQVAQEIGTALDNSVFSMKAFASALFLCEQTCNEGVGIKLVNQVWHSKLVESWSDESVLAVILRLQCAVGDISGATQMFSFMISSKLLRLRSVSVFLASCCQRGDRHMAFAVYQEALRQGIELRAADYVQLGKLCVAVKEPVSTLQFMLREMQEHVMSVPYTMVTDVISPWAAITGIRVAEVCFPNCESTDTPVICSCCGNELKGHRFTTAQKAQLLSDVVQVALAGQRAKSTRVRIAFEAWRRFVSLHGQRIDLLIDGANLGYYGLSSWYEEAKRALLLKRGLKERDINSQDVTLSKHRAVDVTVNFHLIDLAVQKARRRGMRPLVILHERHCETKNMTLANELLATQWRRDGILYCTPSGLNDDLCWLYAALELTTPTDDVSGGVEKTVWVLTNDMMRDHHFRLLSPRFFARWRDRHRIGFKCSREDGQTLLHWEMPAPYAQCMQEMGSCGWHIPIMYPEEGEGDDDAEERNMTDGIKQQPQNKTDCDDNSDDKVVATPLPSVCRRWLCVR